MILYNLAVIIMWNCIIFVLEELGTGMSMLNNCLLRD